MFRLTIDNWFVIPNIVEEEHAKRLAELLRKHNVPFKMEKKIRHPVRRNSIRNEFWADAPDTEVTRMLTEIFGIPPRY